MLQAGGEAVLDNVLCALYELWRAGGLLEHFCSRASRGLVLALLCALVASFLSLDVDAVRVCARRAAAGCGELSSYSSWASLAAMPWVAALLACGAAGLLLKLVAGT